MIPVKLTLKGVYSYQQEQSIDFENLISGQLFGIFGGVGSGKSTILEAISFALYDDTERLNQRDRRNYNMMNLKSGNLLIDFIFRTGNDNAEYRFKVEGRRNSRNFEDVKSFTRSAYKKTNGEWFPISDNSAEEIIGLNYKNFRRTVIIPQGKFQEFLQLGAKDRTQMLKEIFNLDKFELFYKVASLEKKNNEKWENLQGRLVQLNEVTQEEVKARETELVNFLKEKELLEKDFETKQRKLQELVKLKELFESLELQQEQLKKLNTEKPEIAKQEQQLKEYEYCLVHFKPLLDREKELAGQVSSLEKELGEKGKQQAGIEARLKEQTYKFESLKKQYNQREKLNKRAEELQKLAQVFELEKELSGLKERLDKGAGFLQEKNEEVLKLKEEQKVKKEALDKNKKEQPDVAVLSDVRNWFQQQKNIQKDILKLETEHGALRKEIEEITAKKALPQSLRNEFAIDLKTAGFNELIEALNEQVKKVELKKAELQAREKHLMVQRKLEEFAANLHEGEPCPVCGSKLHPEKLNPEGIENDLQKIGKELESSEKKIRELGQYVSEFEKYALLVQEKKGAMSKRKEELKTEEENLKKHRENFKWEKFSCENEKHVEDEVARYQKIKAIVEGLEKELEENSQKQEKANQLKVQAEEKLKKLELDKEKKASQKELLVKQISLLEENDFTRTHDELMSEMEELKLFVANVEKEYAGMEQAIKELTTANDMLNGRLKQGRLQLEQLKAEHKTILKSMDEELEKSPLESMNFIKSRLVQKLDVEAGKRAINDFNLKLNTTLQKIVELQKQAGDNRFDKEEYQQLQKEVNNLSEEIREKQEQQGRMKQQLDKLNTDLKQKIALEKELEKLNKRAENIQTMKQLFKGSGFVNYISSVYLQELCNAANDRFYRLTRQQLKLELTGDNSFVVRDFLNDGKVRSVKTLSGGQTFQAALSLALALAESVQQQSKSNQNFFFLDEGFGTLDKETLQIVFETLKTLRKENRVVGVISHVEELQQEIDVFVKVKNDLENGSELSFSWQ